MGKPFSMDAADPRARVNRLEPVQAEALRIALESLGPAWDGAEGLLFLLPLAECGLTAPVLRRLAGSLPPGWPRDHRQVYFDFRLSRWARHLEPPSLAECLDEYVRTAPSSREGIEYAVREWEAFLARHGANRAPPDTP